ncbi:MAG TPA: amidohydrolase family protein [Planctomycetaceae bacterium]|nr:amidohydrolase family protein [Planctomycetaceae bacterium]
MTASRNDAPESRREFLRRGGEAIALGGLLGSSIPLLAQENRETVNESTIPIVDTHQHLWDLSLFELPWLTGAPESFKRDYVMKDYLAATEGLNVIKAVYMEVNVADAQKDKEAEYVFDLCEKKDNPMAAAVIGGLPHQREFAAYAKKHAKNESLRGVRNVLHDPDRPKGMCLEPIFVDNMQLLGDLGLSFDLCMRPGEISDGVALAKKCPGTRFIIDHCGNMPVKDYDEKLHKSWRSAMKAAAQCDNVVCKISGIVVTAEKGSWTAETLAPHINFCLDTFGEDRVFFGGDWPVCTLAATYSAWTNALKEIVKNRSPEFQRKLFHDNAARLYRLT